MYALRRGRNSLPALDPTGPHDVDFSRLGIKGGLGYREGLRLAELWPLLVLLLLLLLLLIQGGGSMLAWRTSKGPGVSCDRSRRYWSERTSRLGIQWHSPLR